MASKVFVYGTLRQGESNHSWIADQIKSSIPASVRGWLFDLGPYPAMTLGMGWVPGDLVELKNPEKAFQQLDILEDYFGPGHPNNLYERVDTEAFLEGGEREMCQVYIFPERRKEDQVMIDRLLPGGDWRSRKDNKSWVPYFAYGSCMDRTSFAKTVERYAVIGRGEIANQRVAFTRWSSRWQGGVADLIESPGERTEGVLYLVHPEELSSLDEREGAGPRFAHPFYRRKWIKVAVDGITVKALTYEVVNKEVEEIPPSPAYVETILRGTDILSGSYQKMIRQRMKRLVEKVK